MVWCRRGWGMPYALTILNFVAFYLPFLIDLKVTHILYNNRTRQQYYCSVYSDALIFSFLIGKSSFLDSSWCSFDSSIFLSDVSCFFITCTKWYYAFLHPLSVTTWVSNMLGFFSHLIHFYFPILTLIVNLSLTP